MLKCPFCGFANEDGALFCEQCKSDLSSVTPEVPMAAIVEDVPQAALAEAVPLAPGEAPPPGMAVMEAQAVPEALPVPPPLPYNAAAEADPPHAVAVDLAVPAAAAPAAAAPAAAALNAGAQPKLVVMRGQKVGVEFPIYPDDNFIGRADEKPVDIDLEDQEPPDRVWTSRQHAVIRFNEAAGTIEVEDLNSSNGTYVNRNKVYPGQPRPLNVGDVIQIGTVHLKLKA